MRHRSAGIKLNRTSSHRKAMFRNMVTSLFKYERIRTTDAKAKEVRRWADKLITLAKRGDLHARRQALSIIREKDVVHKLFAEAPERFAQVNGGYTRVVKAGFRPGDAAPIAMVELVTPEIKKKKVRRRKKSKVAASPEASAVATLDPEAAETQAGDATTEAAPSPKDDAPVVETAAPETPGEANDPATATASSSADAAAESQAAESTVTQAALEEKPEADTATATDQADTDETPPKGS